MSYDKEKIRKFYEYTLDDYQVSYNLDEVVNVKPVEKIDSTFIQIGIRPILDDDIFISPSMSEYLPGSGRLIAIGEMDFLIKTLLENKEIEKIEFKEDIKEFPKHIDFNNSIILLSTKFYVETFTKLMHRIDYEEKHPRLDRMNRIISISEKILDNKIIIIYKNAILWEKEFFENKITGKKEKIDITIKPASIGKVDITIRSVNKIKHIEPNLIKILEVKNG